MAAIALADCNNFYASAERLFRPDLCARPVIVLSSNDGNVIARSPEAKALGIAMGAPFHELTALIARHHIAVCSANFALYADMSDRVMGVLEQFTPHLEVYSIDESFLDLSHLPAAARHSVASQIRSTVRTWTGIPLSIGIAPTKTLAKLANDHAKALPEGICLLTTDVEIAHALQRTLIEEIWGIGARRAAFLRRHGIIAAADFAQADYAWVKRHLYTPVARTLLELRGIACISIEQNRTQRKATITCSRAFGRPIVTLDELKEALALYVTRAAEKLRAQHALARSLEVFVSTNPFQRHRPQYAKSARVRLPRATTYTPELLRAALAGLERIYRAGIAYHKAGVLLTDLVDDAIVQEHLFAPLMDARHIEVMQLVDAINARYGRDTIGMAMRATTATGWQTRQAQLSPRYTTRWEDLAHAR